MQPAYQARSKAASSVQFVTARSPAASRRGARLDHRFVEEGAALAILDLHDPQIGIELDLALEPGSGLCLVAAFAQGPRPDELAVAAARLVQHRAGAVEPGDLYEN